MDNTREFTAYCSVCSLTKAQVDLISLLLTAIVETPNIELGNFVFKLRKLSDGDKAEPSSCLSTRLI